MRGEGVGVGEGEGESCTSRDDLSGADEGACTMRMRACTRSCTWAHANLDAKESKDEEDEGHEDEDVAHLRHCFAKCDDDLVQALPIDWGS